MKMLFSYEHYYSLYMCEVGYVSEWSHLLRPARSCWLSIFAPGTCYSMGKNYVLAVCVSHVGMRKNNANVCVQAAKEETKNNMGQFMYS